MPAELLLEVPLMLVLAGTTELFEVLRLHRRGIRRNLDRVVQDGRLRRIGRLGFDEGVGVVSRRAVSELFVLTVWLLLSECRISKLLRVMALLPLLTPSVLVPALFIVMRLPIPVLVVGIVAGGMLIVGFRQSGRHGDNSQNRSRNQNRMS